jgi:hypothetical protein
VSSGFLSRFRFNPSFEGDEGLGPKAIEVRTQRCQGLGIDRIEAARSCSAVGDQPRALQDAQMLGNRRPTHRKVPGDRPDRERAFVHQTRENRPAGCVAESVELH